MIPDGVSYTIIRDYKGDYILATADEGAAWWYGVWAPKSEAKDLTPNQYA